MISKHELDILERAEHEFYALYMEAQHQANKARKLYGFQKLKERGIALNKTFVYVTDYRMQRVRAKVLDVNNLGKAICFEIDKQGKLVNPHRQTAICHIDEIYFQANILQES